MGRVILSGGTRMGMPGGLPYGYTRLAYIESTGTQYIDPELTDLTSGWVLEADVRIVSVGSGYQLMFGAQTTTGGANSSWFGTYGSVWAVSGGGALNQGSAVTVGADVHVEASTLVPTNSVYQDGVLMASSSNSTARSALSAYLFCINDAGTANYFSSIRVAGLLNIYADADKSNLVRSLCPAKRNADSVVGMYDKVHGVFYTNAGTGTFSYGEVA